MFPVTILLLSVFFSLRGNSAQSVDQPDAHITVSEGASLELRCSYSYSATPYLFWYMQYPGQSLQFLLKYITGEAVVKGTNGFEAEFKKSNSSFNLKKSPAHWRDSAKYFCALRGTVPETAGGAEHKPPESFYTIHEGTLRTNHNKVTSNKNEYSRGERMWRMFDSTKETEMYHIPHFTMALCRN